VLWARCTLFQERVAQKSRLDLDILKTRLKTPEAKEGFESRVVRGCVARGACAGSCLRDGALVGLHRSSHAGAS